ncbi:putative serine/threonine-protein kinase PIX7 [Camellia lanceoleosa]|uniref:Serine/threonine-protein kinase PIX7 n=1 Tax=Camellia lanceoleosa TaxID=1840588 RepID=A0ACC0FFX2_9ERIC|nr:putative serine/threonine-protein kinase PIX7 [Camellia lanceoleosa]
MRKNAEMKAIHEVGERKKAMDVDLLKFDRKYPIKEIEVAMHRFSNSLKIGEGGYGPVYKAFLDHTPATLRQDFIWSEDYRWWIRWDNLRHWQELSAEQPTHSRVGSKSTNDTNRDQPVAPIISSSTTSNAGSTPSTPNIAEELKISSQLRKFAFNELKSRKEF